MFKGKVLRDYSFIITFNTVFNKYILLLAVHAVVLSLSEWHWVSAVLSPGQFVPYKWADEAGKEGNSGRPGEKWQNKKSQTVAWQKPGFFPARIREYFGCISEIHSYWAFEEHCRWSKWHVISVFFFSWSLALGPFWICCFLPDVI